MNKADSVISGSVVPADFSIKPLKIGMSPSLQRELDKLCERTIPLYKPGAVLTSPDFSVPSRQELRRAVRKIEQGGRYLAISKEEACFYLKLPRSSTNNLLGAGGRLHFGEWRVHLVEKDTRVLLAVFGTWADAALYVSRATRAAAFGEDMDDVELDQYAGVGEVPC